MRNSLIFKGVKEEDYEDTWDKTEDKLAEHISETCNM